MTKPKHLTGYDNAIQFVDHPGQLAVSVMSKLHEHSVLTFTGLSRLESTTEGKDRHNQTK